MENAEAVNDLQATEQKAIPDSAQNSDKGLQDEITRLKEALSRANSSAADWKRQYKATLDEAKQKEMEAEERRKAELAELESLRTDKRINTYKARLMEAGVDGATADLMAKALPEGVGDEYFTATKTFLSNQRLELETAALKKQPPLSVGTPPSGGSIKSEEDKKYDRWFGLT